MSDKIGRPRDAFDALLHNADEVLRLPRRVREALAGRAPGSFDGFSALLDAVLPTETAAEVRIARAMHLPDDALARLRRRTLDPAGLPPASLTALARALDLDWTTFDALVQRDLTRGADDAMLSMLRSCERDAEEVRAAYRDAWEHEERDDPRHIQP